jgi:hypothetical protein
MLLPSPSRWGRRTMSSRRSDLLHLLLEGRDAMAPAGCGLDPAMGGRRSPSDPAYTGNWFSQLGSIVSMPPASKVTVSLPVPQSMLSTSPSTASMVSSLAPPKISSTSSRRLSLASIWSSPSPPFTVLLPMKPSRSPSAVDPLPSSPGPPLMVSSPAPPSRLRSLPGPPRTPALASGTAWRRRGVSPAAARVAWSPFGKPAASLE